MSPFDDPSENVAPLLGPLGRAREWRRLRELRTQAAAGHGLSVLLEGETGIGKTALLRAFGDACEQAGFLVLRGSGNVLEQRIPFQLIRTCFESLPPVELADRRDDLADLFVMLGGQNTFGSADWEFSVTDAMRSVLDRWCTRGPVALVLDDLHLADDSSLVALSHLHRSLRQLPLLVCATVQQAPLAQGPGSVLRTLHDRWTYEMSLGPLDRTSVDGLVREQLGAEPGPKLRTYVGGAAGNPLFVSELVGGLVRTGGVRTRDGVAELALDGPGVPAMPQSLRAAVLGRFADLSAGTKEFMAVMAVMGPRVRLRDLSIVLGVPALRLWTPAKEVVDMGLLEDSGEYLAFRHALVKQVVLDNLPLSLRRALELQAGRRLVQSGSPEQIAEFLYRARIPLDGDLVSQLVDIAPAMVLRAPSAAVGVLRQALTEPGTRDDQRPALYRNAVDALLRTGEYTAAGELAATALESVTAPDERRELHWSFIQSRYQQGRYAEAATAIGTALRVLGADGAGRAKFQCMAAMCAFRQALFERAGEEAELAARAGEAEEDPYAIAFAFNLLSILSAREIHLAESLAQADKALDMLSGQDIDPDLPLVPHFMKGIVFADLECVEEAYDAFDQGLRHCQGGGNFYLTWYHLGKSRVNYHDGRWDDALAEIGAGLETVDHVNMFAALHGQAALIAVHRGQQPDIAHLAAQSHYGPADVYGYLHKWALALAHEARGESREALDILSGALDALTSVVRLRFLFKTAPDTLRLAWTLGDSGRIRTLCEELADLAEVSEFRGVDAELMFARGLAGQDPGMLEDAAAGFRRGGWVLYEAYASEAAAETYAMLGQLPAARTALQSALALYERIGAVMDAGRAEKRLAQAGVRLRRRAAPARRTGWEALTATEREIAGLVAEGRSNPEIGARLFLSPRTVQFHLTAIFTKLGLTSRVELAVSFRGQEESSTPPA